MATTILTGETITRRQIRELGIAAFERDDMSLFDVTAAAYDLDTNNPHVAAARRTCADAINAARGAA